MKSLEILLEMFVENKFVDGGVKLRILVWDVRCQYAKFVMFLERIDLRLDAEKR